MLSEPGDLLFLPFLRTKFSSSKDRPHILADHFEFKQWGEITEDQDQNWNNEQKWHEGRIEVTPIEAAEKPEYRVK